MREQVCLIVPCYNEAKRLDLAQFEAAVERDPLWVVFVDDGSTDGTGDMVRKHTSERIWLIDLERNVGKSEAVRQGIVRAAALPFYARLGWIGYWDADLSTPLEELPRYFEYQELAGVRADAIFGSRVSKLGSKIMRRAVRHVLGRMFATVSSLLLGTRAYDSQCGAKVFRIAAAQRCFEDSFITRWLFDLEILLRLNGAVVLEYPLMEWRDVSGSKMTVLPNVWRTVRDLLRLRAKYRRYE
jgi:glycosyltransferase involved in cell wall biosynthesis